jgi:hypothetical protein
MIGREALLFLPLRVVVDHQLDRVEYRGTARCGFVEVVALAFLEHADVDPRVRLGDADHFGEAAEGLRREAAAARADQGRQARVVPAVDVLFFDQLDQLALGEHDIGEIQPGELDLLRQRRVDAAGSASRASSQS